MERMDLDVRPQWQQAVEKLGFTTHSFPGTEHAYWDESACWVFSKTEAELLAHCAASAYKKALSQVQEVIDSQRFEELGIPFSYAPAIVRSWERDDPTFHTRIDFAYDGKSMPRQSQIVGASPAGLFEAAAVQWEWKCDRFPTYSQFNTAVEELRECWRQYAYPGTTQYFVRFGDAYIDEQIGWLEYTARETGVAVKSINIEEICWNPSAYTFMDPSGSPLEEFFTGYPLTRMLQDPFGDFVRADAVVPHEPLWKMIVDSPGFLNGFVEPAVTPRSRTRVSVWLIGGAPAAIACFDADADNCYRFVPHVVI